MPRLTLQIATAADAPALAALHTAVSERLTSKHGHGPWSAKTSEKAVLFAMRHSSVFVTRRRARIIGALRLTTKKPWAIDTRYFSKSKKPLYLLAMAVLPELQRQGIGKRCIEAVEEIARSWFADAIRLDAYDADAGAGGFYSRCGFDEVGRATYRNAPLIYYELLLR
jgi:GNAT superfamily N-acetyltransferase